MIPDRKPLSADQEATLRHMRREVDALQDELLSADVPPPNAALRLQHARQRLSQFTRSLRAAGYRV